MHLKVLNCYVYLEHEQGPTVDSVHVADNVLEMTDASLLQPLAHPLHPPLQDTRVVSHPPKQRPCRRICEASHKAVL